MRSGTPFSLMDTTNDLDRNGLTSNEYLPAGTYSGIGQDAITVDYKGGRNGAYGPAYARSTCAWVSVPLRGGRALNAFVDVFNATNEPNFANPINFNTNTANASDLRLAPTFLKLTNLVNGVTRTFQLNKCGF